MIFQDRKHPPHLPTLETATPTLLITVCTKYRRKILANPTTHALLREAWQTYNDFSVGRYVILPDHIHLFVGDSDLAPYKRTQNGDPSARFLGARWVVSGRRKRRTLRALGRQYVSVRPRLAVAPDHTEGLAHARPPDGPRRTGFIGSCFNLSLTVTERSVISGQ
jgi:REP element-mobilizing transposase RayT